MNYILKFLFLFIFATTSAFALLDVDKQDLLYKNYYTNGGFENGLKDVTVSSSLKALESTTIRSGKRALKCTFDAAADYCELKLVTIPGDTQNAIATVWYYTTAATIKMSVYDSGGNEINNITYLPSNSGYQKAEVSFVAVSGTTYKIRFTESSGASVIYVDDVWMGENYLIGNISQAVLWGSIQWQATANCRWSVTNSATFADFGADADCDDSAITYTGHAIADASNPGQLPQIRLDSMPAGNYIFVTKVMFNSYQESATSSLCGLELYDGTNEIYTVYQNNSNNHASATFTNYFPGFTTVYNKSTDSSDITWKLRAFTAAAATSSCYINNDTGHAPTGIYVYYFPPTSQQAIKSDQANKFGSVSWLNVSNCTFSNTGGIMTDSDCNTGTVLPTGSVTSGDDNFQLTATNLKSGSVYKITANGAFRTAYSGSGTGCDFQLYDGTTFSGSARGYAGDATQDSEWSDAIVGYYSYTSFQASKTFSVYATRTGGSGTCDCFGNSTTKGCSISIEEVYPNAAQPQIIDLIPAGTVMEYTGTTAPSGNWLLCDGTSYLRADYPKLYAVIGNKYGAADSTHFNVPDMRGKFARGYASGQSTDPDRASRTACATGGNTGDNIGSCQADAMQGHKHGPGTSTSYLYTANDQLLASAGLGVYSANHLSTTTGVPVTDGTNGTPRTTSESRPTNVSFNYIIKY